MASIIRSTWSLKTPSMPMSSSSARWRGSWASQPRATSPKRWNRVVSPPVHSVVVQVHRVDARVRTARRPARSGPSRKARSLQDATSLAPSDRSRQRDQDLGLGVAEPQLLPGPDGVGRGQDGVDGVGVLDVEAEREVRCRTAS